MATATKTTKTIEKTITEAVEVITLELSRDEATALRGLAGMVSGEGPTREHIDSIYFGLGNAGVGDPNLSSFEEIFSGTVRAR